MNKEVKKLLTTQSAQILTDGAFEFITKKQLKKIGNIKNYKGNRELLFWSSSHDFTYKEKELKVTTIHEEKSVKEMIEKYHVWVDEIDKIERLENLDVMHAYLDTIRKCHQIDAYEEFSVDSVEFEFCKLLNSSFSNGILHCYDSFIDGGERILFGKMHDIGLLIKE